MRYFESLRDVYAAILSEPTDGAAQTRSLEDALKSLDAAETEAAALYKPPPLNNRWRQRLASFRLRTRRAANRALLSWRRLPRPGISLSASATIPISRSIPISTAITCKTPWSGKSHVCSAKLAIHRPYSGSMPQFQPTAGHALKALDAITRSTTEEIERNLTSAYRGNADGRLRQKIEGETTKMLSSIAAYYRALTRRRRAGEPAKSESRNDLYKAPVNNTVAAWTIAQAELKILLEERIDVLLGKLRRSLLLTGALAALSLLVVFPDISPHRKAARAARGVGEDRPQDEGLPEPCRLQERRRDWAPRRRVQ